MQLSGRTVHFEDPPQWVAMRKAQALEREAGTRLVHLEKGDFQGDEFRPPSRVTEACQRAISDGMVRYVPGPGLPELREAIAEEMSRRGRPTTADEVIVTMGAKHALTQVLLTVLDSGDEVLVPNPGYPPDRFWIRYAGARPIDAPLVGPDFQFDLEALEPLMRRSPKLLIVNTPQRPNGMVVRQLERLAQLCVRHSVIALSDEIFSRIVFSPSQHETITAIPEMPERSASVDTFSKTYAMTGFRIGWCVASRELVRHLDIFQQNSVTNVPAFVQLAALAALTGPQDDVADRLYRLRAKRDRVVAALNAMPGIDCPTPDGTFYVFPSIEGTGLTAEEFADHLLSRHAVAVVAGTAFGALGEGHVRLTFAVPDETLDEGLARIQAAVEELAEGLIPQVH